MGLDKKKSSKRSPAKTKTGGDLSPLSEKSKDKEHSARKYRKGKTNSKKVDVGNYGTRHRSDSSNDNPLDNSEIEL